MELEMLEIRKTSGKSWIRCASCSETVRTFEPYLKVFVDGRAVKGENYCHRCERYARENNQPTTPNAYRKQPDKLEMLEIERLTGMKCQHKDD